MTPDDPELPDMTAPELALGLLEGEERAAALRRTLSEPGFAREVQEWRDRLAGLFDDYLESPAPPMRADTKTSTPRPVRWQWPVIGLLTAVAAAFGLLLLMRPAPPPPVIAAPHELMVASLVTSDKAAAIPALLDVTAGEVRVDATGLAPGGKSAELWMIGGDGVPRSMGLLTGRGQSRVAISPDKRTKLSVGVTLAISIEPIGGSPTGKPTGPVVASGKLSTA